jgi:hypothetical protein
MPINFIMNVQQPAHLIPQQIIQHHPQAAAVITTIQDMIMQIHLAEAVLL